MNCFPHISRSFIVSRQYKARYLVHKAFKDSTPVSFSDPWPLPNSPEHVKSTVTPPDELRVPPLDRPNESLDVLRARLVYQTRKRGTLESDLLLSTFAKEWLGKMDGPELKAFDKLLDEPDWDIYYWATNMREPPTKWAQSPILEKLRIHARNEGKQVRRMPDLS